MQNREEYHRFSLFVFLIGNNPDLPTAVPTLYAGAQMPPLADGSPAYSAPMPAVDYTANSPLATAGQAAVSIASNIGTVTLPAGAIASALTASGIASYRPALDSSNPQPGEFIQVGNVVTVQLRSGESPSQFSYFGVFQHYPPSYIPTNQIFGPFPDLYTRWNIEGQISYKRSFEGHPSADFFFSTDASNYDDVRSVFYNRAPITLYDMGFEVNSCTIDEYSVDLYPAGRIRVHVSLTGRHEYLMNEPLFIRVFNSRGWDATSVAILAQKVGLTINGPEMPYTISPDVSYGATTTVSSLLSEGYNRLAQGFNYLSSPDAIEVRTFGATTEHFISPADIRGEGDRLSFIVNYPGKEQYWQGVQLDQVYKKAVLQFNLPDATGVGVKDIVTPQENPEVPAVVPDLRSLGYAFDSGGPTKSQKTTKMIGKTVIQETEVVWGYAFCGADVYSVVTVSAGVGSGTSGKQAVYNAGINPGAYWVLVRETTTTWSRDSYGYLTKIDESGTRRTRLKQESNQETLALIVDRDGATGTTADTLDKQINAYRFNLIANTEKLTEYELEPLANHFLDTPITPGEPPAKFCVREHTIENSLYSAPDPDSTTSDPKPPITTGKYFEQTISRTIASTVKDREAYNETTTTQNIEGTNLKNGLVVSNTVYKQGRPPVHQRDNDAIVLVSSLNPSKLVANPNLKYLLLTQGSTYTSTIDRGSKSYPTRFVEDARAAAELDLAIVNSQRSASSSPRLAYNRNYQEGDMIWIKGRKWVIYSVDWTEKFEGTGVVTCDGMQMAIGQFLRIPVVIQTVPAYF